MRALRASQAFDAERFKGLVDVVFEGERLIEVSLRRHRRHVRGRWRPGIRRILTVGVLCPPRQAEG